MCEYYRKNYLEIKNFIFSENFEMTCARNIEIYDMVSTNDFYNQIVSITDSYGFLVTAIEESESRNFTIIKAYKSFNSIKWGKDYANIREYAYKRWKTIQ